eukprot:3628730-Pyramimonas_sp.AAC.1
MGWPGVLVVPVPASEPARHCQTALRTRAGLHAHLPPGSGLSSMAAWRRGQAWRAGLGRILLRCYQQQRPLLRSAVSRDVGNNAQS